MKSLSGAGKVTRRHSTTEGNSKTENGGGSGGPPVESISKMWRLTARYDGCRGLSAEVVVHHEMQQCGRELLTTFVFWTTALVPPPRQNEQ